MSCRKPAQSLCNRWKPRSCARSKCVKARWCKRVNCWLSLTRLLRMRILTSALLASLQPGGGSRAYLGAEAADRAFTYAGSDLNWMLQASIYGLRQAEFGPRSKTLRIDSRNCQRQPRDPRSGCRRLPRAPWLCGGRRADARKTLEAHAGGSRLNTLIKRATSVRR